MSTVRLGIFAKIVILLAFAAVVACGCLAGYAFARDNAKYSFIPENVYCDGIDLGGMTVDEATKTLEAYAADHAKKVVLNLVDNEGKFFPIDLSGHITYDIAGAVKTAIAANQDTPILQRIMMDTQEQVHERLDIALTFRIDYSSLRSDIAAYSDAVLCEPVNAWRSFNNNNTVTVFKEISGRCLDVENTYLAAVAQLDAVIAESGNRVQGLIISNLRSTMALDIVQPEITTADFPPAIILDYSLHMLFIFEQDRLIYQCGIGIGRGWDEESKQYFYSPTGLQWVEYKDPAPTWTNPDPEGWGKDMEPFIDAGPECPMGLRALKVANEPMIFIHGVPDINLIGINGSHGCINVYNDNILEIYEIIPEPGVYKDRIWVYMHY